MASRPIIALPEGQHYRRFSLSIPHAEVALLPSEHEFILDPETGHYIIINWASRYVVADGVFNVQELLLALTLLDGWPSYVPYQKLVHAVSSQHRGESAEMAPIADSTSLKQLSHIVETCQSQFHHIGIHIEETHQLGYKLSVYTEPAADC